MSVDTVVHPLTRVVSAVSQIFRTVLLPCMIAAGSMTAAVAMADDSEGNGKPTPAPPGSGVETRIVGGIPAGANEFPWMASLSGNWSGNPVTAHFCGATVISPTWVLTAAHCVARVTPDQITVVTGRTDLFDTRGDSIPARRFVVHPGYDGSVTGSPDIALIQLDRPTTAPAVHMAAAGAQSESAGGAGITVGWGDTLYQGSPSRNLLKAGVPVWTLDACRNAYAEFNVDIVDTDMICAGVASGGVGSCQGDSGGPLLVYNANAGDFEQIGVTSFGVGCAVPSIPAVYARVANYAEWIGRVARLPVAAEPNPELRANFNADCADLVCELDGRVSAEGTSRIVSYHWLLGDGRERTGARLRALYRDPGHYSVLLTVTDQNGNMRRARRTVTVDATSAGTVRQVTRLVIGDRGSLVYPDQNGVWANAGRLIGQLAGPETSQIDLFLQRYAPESATWELIDQSRTPGAREVIAMTSEPGLYRWVVRSYSGGGSVTLVTLTP